MFYEDLNKKNKNHMHSEINTDLQFEWEDSSLMDILLEKFDAIYPYSSDPEEFINDQKVLNEINSYINDFNKRRINSEEFINKMGKALTALIEKFPSLNYREKYKIDYYKERISESRKLIIDGEAGIGKSYFLYKLEENLTKSSISHLCVYCKYTKKIDSSVIDEILMNNSKFYFIVDAINELSEIEQIEFLKIISNFKDKENINIIVSYRTSDLSENNKIKLKNELMNTYTFKGVSYESSLVKLIETYGIETSKFIDVLETSNPFFIKMLYEILTDEKIRKNKIGDLVQITFILESYIKRKTGNEFWEDTKKVSKYMYDNEEYYIDYDLLKNILGDRTDKYIKTMLKSDLIDYYTYENKKRYIFKIQYLSDYLIARTMQYEITNLSDQEIIELINKKISKLFSISEAVTILLIDRYKQENIRKSLDIIFSSKLKENFNISIFKKIIFSDNQIKQIQSLFKNIDWNQAFLELGGYHNRPFNCVYYINDILVRQNECGQQIIPKYTISLFLIKLKNALYNIVLINNNNEYIEEMFWYSLWLTSTPDERIRLLSKKALFDIVNKYDGYLQKLIDVYDKINDYYIKNAIIQVFTSVSNLSKNELSFLEKVVNNFNELSAENIYRISNCLNINYINLNKDNMYLEITDNDKVAEDLDLRHILFIADIYEKYLLKFERYGKGNELSLSNNFILNDKNEIKEWNRILNQKFECISENGYCKYSCMYETLKKCMPSLDLKKVDNKKMFLAFEKIFIKVCKKYSYKYDKNERFDEHINKFSNSILKKCLLISQDILLGSLMCNYYIDDFSIYNDDEHLGYMTYKPFLFSEEEFNILSPVSLYSEDIDRLNYKVEKELDLYGDRDENWYKNSNLSLTNIKKLTNSIIYKGKEWSLIGADIHQYVSDEDNNHIFTETYDFSISVDSPLNLKGDNNSRNLTIDRDTYYKNVKEYSNSKNFKNASIKSIMYNSYDFKETYLSFPPSIIIKDLELKYDNKHSTWIDSKGKVIIYCDNNSREYYKTKITKATYIQTKYLNLIKEKHSVKYWAYTEKNYMEEGWNEDACIHVELNSDGDTISIFKNSELANSKEKYNKKCEKCKFGIYQEMSKPFDYSKLSKILIDFDDIKS